MTIRNGNHCFGYLCTCGAAKSGYGSESQAAKAERHHAELEPRRHQQQTQGGVR